MEVGEGGVEGLEGVGVGVGGVVGLVVWGGVGEHFDGWYLSEAGCESSFGIQVLKRPIFPFESEKGMGEGQVGHCPR